jgi:sugar phosphate isomerase/epimerase
VPAVALVDGGDVVRFGVCAGLRDAEALKSQGWDHIDVPIQAVFDGLKSDDEWTGAEALANCPLPMPSGAMLLPGHLKVCGPSVDAGAIESYIRRTFSRAARFGTRTLVFGSGVARSVPDGFDRQEAKRQIISFLRLIAPIGAEFGVTVVVEPLNRSECNILNTVGEALGYVREVNHPNVRQLFDSYHSWLEAEPLTALRSCGSLLKHVHVADKIGRLGPGMSGQSDYRAIFRILKELNYDGVVSVEARMDIKQDGPRVLQYLRDQWAKA